MAFATKYRTTIKSWDGDTITADIQEDGFLGTLEEFDAVGGNAITVEHQVNVNKKESYIIPSKAVVRVYVNNEWDLNELLYATDRQFKVIIKNGSNEVFIGWVIAGINTEEYTTGRYAVTIQAIDGLGDLKNIPYLNSGALYNAFQTPLTIIRNCLAETGLVNNIWENTDIYAAAGMTTTTNTHSPLNQSYIHSKSYGDTIENVLSCWDVLEKIMQGFHCRLFQYSLNALNIRWVISKINAIGDTTTYRQYNTGGGYSSFVSYVPLLTMGTDIQHVNGKGQISIKQGYKEVELTTDRGLDYSILQGNNFEPDDFPTSSSLSNWGALDKAKLVSTWSTATIAQETFLGNEVASLEPFTDARATSYRAATNSGGKVSLNEPTHGLTTSDWIIIPEGIYLGMWKVTSVTDANNFLIDADYASDEQIVYYEISVMTGIEANFLIPLANDIAPVTDDDQNINIEFSFNIQSSRIGTIQMYPVCVIVLVYNTPTSYKILNSNGDWVQDDLLQIHPIIANVQSEATQISNELHTVKVTGNMNDAFFSTRKMYVGLMSLNGNSGSFVDRVSYESIKIWMSGDGNDTNTTAIETDFIDSLNVDFFHPDGDGGNNDEYRHLHPIYDDATPKRFINSWQEDGGTADNLQDLSQANLVAAYTNNSQIWSGTLKGDINISNAIKDPLNFDRIFQIQKIRRNFETNYCSISMIENAPGGDLINASVSMAGEVEWTKGASSTQVKTVTITNDGNIDLILTAAFLGDDDTYFNFDNSPTFNLAVGASYDLDMSVDSQTSGIYVSRLTITDARANYDLLAAAFLAHISTNSPVSLRRDIPQNATVLGVIGSGSVTNNKINGVSIPSSNISINTVLSPTVQTWQLQVSGIAPSFTGTLNFRDTATVYNSEALTSVSVINELLQGHVGVTDYFGLAQAGWNGTTDLYFEIV